MLSKDYSAEFKQRFADRYADGTTIAMLQHEFGLTKSTVKLWRERIDQGGVGAIDRPSVYHILKVVQITDRGFKRHVANFSVITGAACPTTYWLSSGC